MHILILNGPNLNLIGRREPSIYGNRSFEDYLKELRRHCPDNTIGYFQSNVEGELINSLHEADGHYDGVVLNAGGYTHTSVAIGDAIGAIQTPVIEVHISRVSSREPFRQLSHISANCAGSISGFGLDSYRLAIEALKLRSENRRTPRK